MKKIVLPVAAVVVATALIAPKIIGSQFTEGLNNTVASINANPAYSASVINVEDGWFSTQAIVNVSINVPSVSPSGEVLGDYSFDVSVLGDHGPFITSGGLSLGLLRTHISTLEGDLPVGLTVKNNAPIYDLVAHTGLFGNSTYTNEIAAIEYYNADAEMTVVFSGMSGDGSFSNDHIQSSNQGALLSVNIGDAILFDTNNFKIDANIQTSIANVFQTKLYDSTLVASVDNMNITNNIEGSETDIQSLVVDVVTTLNKDSKTPSGNMIFTTNVANVETNTANVTDLLATVEIINLEEAFLKAYQEFSVVLSDYSIPMDERTQATKVFFAENLLSQLELEPQYNLSALSGKINGSSFDGKALFKLVGVTELPATMEDPNFWMQHAHVNTEMYMQKEAAEFIATQVIAMQMAGNPNFANMTPEQQQAMLAQQVAPTIGALVQQGMLVASEDGYEFVFTMQDRTGNLNGLPIPL